MRFLLAALLFGVANLAHAQQAQQPICGDLKDVMNELMKEHKELPIWIGVSEKGNNYALLGNIKDKNWTLVQYNDKTACLILAGIDFKLFTPNSGTRIRINSQNN